MKKVIVLLSTYNGEQYVEGQINSILGQTYKDIEIFVRDDGSTDNTVRTLKKFEKAGKLTFVEGKNIGFIKSFLWLINNSGDADYYSFADQDDIWLEDKVMKAVEALEECDKNLPLLYFSEYDFFDENMNFLDHHKPFKSPPELFYAVTGKECALGFTTTINRRLKEIIKADNPEITHLYGHDFYLYLVALSIGKVIYDKEVTAKYRRHSKNVSEISRSFLDHQLWRIKSFIYGEDAKKISKSVKICKDLYYDLMDKDTQALFDLFSFNKYNFLIAIKKTFYPKRYRESLFDEVGIRLIYLVGKM